MDAGARWNAGTQRELRRVEDFARFDEPTAVLTANPQFPEGFERGDIVYRTEQLVSAVVCKLLVGDAKPRETKPREPPDSSSRPEHYFLSCGVFVRFALHKTTAYRARHSTKIKTYVRT